ncbi:MAG: ATP-binding protein [Candidatus Methanoplasma sp.]|jgi:predicted AAA+ superfamily ATPase|nr:ATP-binding protein [Candidatus Methanoplasma sp.]
MILRKQYLDTLIRLKDNTKFIKIITGIRRCGKSTLMLQFADYLKSAGINENDIFHIDLELYNNRDLLSADSLHEFLESNLTGRRTYLMIDEIQKINGWESVIRSAMSEFDTDIYITGSNAYMLSSELATLLSGRCVEVKMLPLSFSEFIELNGYSRDDVGESELMLYLSRGSFPMISKEDSQESITDYLEGVYNTVIMKDIITRKKDSVRNGPLLERLVKYLFSTCGSPVSPFSISRQLGYKDSNTVDSYLRMLEETFIVYRAERYDLKGKKILMNVCKYYCTDTGMRNAVLGAAGTDIGHLLENIVYLELLRRGFKVYVGVNGDKEIDFVAKRASETRYYQVTQSMASPDVEEREVSSLLSFKDNYPKTILSLDRFIIGGYSGIEHVNIIDFLLGKD